MVKDLRCLLNNEAVLVRTYDHKTGRFSSPKLKKSRNVICVSGLHSLFTEDLAGEMDRRFYLDMDEDLRVKLKITRDIQKRGRSKEFTLSEIARRSEDAKNYIHPQASRADVVFSLMPTNPNLSEEDPEKIKLKLRVKLRRGGYYDDLRRALIGVCGLNINVNYIDNRGAVELDIQGGIEAEDAGIDMPQLLNFSPGGPLGSGKEVVAPGVGGLHDLAAEQGTGSACRLREIDVAVPVGKEDLGGHAHW